MELNFIKTINEPSASINPVTQLGSNTFALGKYELLLLEYDLIPFRNLATDAGQARLLKSEILIGIVCKTELKDNSQFSLVVNIFTIFIITTLIININIVHTHSLNSAKLKICRLK